MHREIRDAERHPVEQGQTMAEYSVVLAVISLVIIMAIAMLSGAAGAAIDRATALITGT